MLLQVLSMTMLYGLDSTRVTLREYRYGTPLLLMPLVLLTRLFRISLPGSTDDPPVETLKPFEVEPSALPEEVREKFQPLLTEMAGLDFSQPIYHMIQLPHLATRIYWATLLHRTGQVVARIHYRIWASPEGQRTFLFPQFLSMLEDGSYLVTSGGKPDMLTPESVRIVHHPKASVETLWQRHHDHLNDLLPHSARPITHHEQLRAILERHHVEIRNFNLDRGVFKPLPPEMAIPTPVVTEGGTTTSAEDAAVIAEIERLQTQKRSWGSALLVLFVSVLLFLGATHWQFGLGELWALVPVIFFHELGHYVAMHWFGYRNLRMFFIPFFGAAVSGRNYNVAGWKKAVVALMGPVPGIALGLALAGAGAYLGKVWLIHLALMCVILNGFNLLPFLPLDGGWVLHAVLFARHPVLDLLFRLVAIGGMVTLALLAQDRLLIYISIPMLIGLPGAFRVARIAHRLRHQEAIAVSPDNQTIPPEAVSTILAEVRKSFPTVAHPKLLATYVANIFETLNSRPPGFLASLAILFVHGASIVVAIVAAAICVLGLAGDARGTLALLAQRPQHRYQPGTSRVWQGAQAPKPSAMRPITLIATFEDADTAGRFFAALPQELPPQTTMRLFGETLFVTFPGDAAGEKASKPWIERLKGEAVHFVVDQKVGRTPTQLYCVIPSDEVGKELVEELQQYFQAPLAETLFPPWSETWANLPAPQREQYQLARQTYARLQELSTKSWQLPEIQALRAEIDTAYKNRDLAAAQKLSQKADELQRAELLRQVAALGNPDDAPVDPKVVEIWKRYESLTHERMALEEKLEDEEDGKAKAFEKKFAALEAQIEPLTAAMASLMGQVPQAAGNKDAAVAIEGTLHGTVERRGLYLALRNLTFAQPAEGLPALTEWLHARQAVDFYYGFENPFLDALRKAIVNKEGVAVDPEP